MMYLWLTWLWLFYTYSTPGNTCAFEDEHTRFDLDNMLYLCPRHEKEVAEILKAKGLV